MPQTYTCYSQCYVNGVKFVVWDRDRKKTTQNSGVMVDDGELTYYGIIKNIIELHYANGMPVVVFYCTWFNTDPKERGSTKRDYGLLSIDTSTTWYEDWPYFLATTARQVFYLNDIKAGDNWKVVNVVSHRGVYSDSSLAREDETEIANSEEDDPYQEKMPTYITKDDTSKAWDDDDDSPMGQFNYSSDASMDNQDEEHDSPIGQSNYASDASMDHQDTSSDDEMM
ncbi:hypothetical protein QQ045_006399 [Rhodiola kirilowii]